MWPHSIAHLQRLHVLGHLIEGRTAVCVDLMFMAHEISKENAPMGAHLTVWDFLLVQQIHEERTGYIQHIGSLLRREFGMDRNQCDGIVRRHFIKDGEQKSHSRRRQQQTFMGFPLLKNLNVEINGLVLMRCQSMERFFRKRGERSLF